MEDIFTKLRFVEKKHGIFRSLPLWARFYIDLGSEIVQRYPKSQKVVAVSVPSRAFVSLFVLTGAIASLAINSDDAKSSTEYFEQLRELPVGTTLVTKYRDAGKIKTGIKIKSNDDNYVRVQVTAGKGSKAPVFNILTLGNCLDWEIRSDDNTKLRGQEKIGPLDDGHNFRTKVFRGFNNAENFYKTNGVECLVVGEMKSLEVELLDDQFTALGPNGELDPKDTGSLQDIARVKRLGRGDNGYKCEIISDRASATTNTLEPRLVILDGSNSYLRWKMHFEDSSANIIVILDRTDSRYHDCFEQLNSEFLDRHDELALNMVSRIPRGIDVMGYLRGLS